MQTPTSTIEVDENCLSPRWYSFYFFLFFLIYSNDSLGKDEEKIIMRN